MTYSCRGYDCKCKDWQTGAYIRPNFHCSNCSHSDGCHIDENGKSAMATATSSEVNQAEKAKKAEVKADKPAKVEAPVEDGQFTMPQMRQILIDNKVPGVGQRGRMKPEHKKLAIELLSRNN